MKVNIKERLPSLYHIKDFWPNLGSQIKLAASKQHTGEAIVNVRFVFLLAILGVVGCSDQPEYRPTGSKRSTPKARSRTIGDLLLENPTLHSLSKLVPEAKLERIGNATIGCRSAWRHSKSEDEGIVNRMCRIKSFDSNYIITPISVSRKFRPGGEDAVSGAMMCYTDMVVVVNDEGGFIGKVGGAWAPDEMNGDVAAITNLGSPENWFVMTTRFEKNKGFDQETNVYMVKDGLPRAVRILHHANNMWLTLKPEELRESEYSVIGFSGKERVMHDDAQGIGADGKRYSPELLWIPEEGKFVGPSSLHYNGQDIFLVDILNSEKYRQLDNEK